MKRVLVSIPLAFLFSACTNTPYEKTLTGPTAKLVVENHSRLEAFTYAFLDAQKCTDMKLLPPPVPANGIKEYKVAASAPLTFTVATTGMSPGVIHNCFFTAMFTPTVDRTYRAIYQLGEDSCYLSMFEVQGSDSGDAKPKPVKFVKRTYRTPFTASQGFCADQLP